MNATEEPLGAIDVGTNCVLLSIVLPRRGQEPLRVLQNLSLITRLGEGVDRTGRLSGEAVRRTLGALESYRQVLDQAGCRRLWAVGTSALRDARESDTFLARAEEILGVPLTVISGEREAELTFKGALCDLDRPEEVFVFDIGGGSTELILGNAKSGQITQSQSLPLGTVRLRERYELDAPLSNEKLTLLRRDIRAVLRTAPRPSPTAAAVGVAGTVTTLKAIQAGILPYDAEKVHGTGLSVQQIGQLAEKLGQMTKKQLLQVPGLSEGRADLIVPGAHLCLELCAHAGVGQLTVSDRGVRFGLLEDALEQADKRSVGS